MVKFMRKLRTMLFFFLLILCLFLNIERIDIGGQTDVVNIQSFVYVLGAIAVLSTVWLPEIWRPNDGLLVGFWLVVYIILKGVIFNTRPIVGGIHTYITITEIAFLVLILLMVYRVSKYIYDLEETVATVTLGDVSDRVKRMDQAEKDIAKELARSRRYDTPLSVLVMKVHPETTQFEIHQTAEEILQGMIKRYTSNRLIRLLDRDLRRSDLVLERPKDDQIVVLLPETSAEGIAVLTNRIQSIVNLHLGLSVSYGYACFPKDAITFDDLLNRAETRFDSPRLSHSDLGIDGSE
jgi:GGDEF domain-containing protein